MEGLDERTTVEKMLLKMNEKEKGGGGKKLPWTVYRDCVTKPNNIYTDRTVHLLLHRTADAATTALPSYCGPLKLIIRKSRHVLL